MAYKIEINKSKKWADLAASGFVQIPEGMKFVEEFHSKIADINCNEYVLILDGSKLEVSEENSAPILEGLLNTYAELAFKVRILIRCESPIAHSQIKRLLKSKYGKYFTEVENRAEALKIAEGV